MYSLKYNFGIIKKIANFCIMGLIIGCFVGAVEALYCQGLTWIFEFRKGKELLLLPLIPFVGLLIAYVFIHWGKNSSEGIGLVFKVEQGKEDRIPVRMVPFMIMATWLSHLAGCSVGREGVAVQIGADVSHFFGRYFKFGDSDKIYIVTGIAAGFSGLFGTPITAVFFALEVLVAGAINYMSLCPAFVAAFTSYVVSEYFGVVHEKFLFVTSWNLSVPFVLKIACMGIIFGLVGQLFTLVLAESRFLSRVYFKSPYHRIFLMGIGIAICLFLFGGRYCGLGSNLISYAMEGKTIYIWDWLLKMVLTCVCLSAGFQGGEVMPLFSIGASLGCVLASLLGLPLPLGAALGFVAVFGAGTNTFLAPIAVGLEMFGSQYLYLFFIVCSISYLFNKNQSIYAYQETIRK